jgi:hypothetical protein
MLQECCKFGHSLTKLVDVSLVAQTKSGCPVASGTSGSPWISHGSRPCNGDRASPMRSHDTPSHAPFWVLSWPFLECKNLVVWEQVLIGCDTLKINPVYWEKRWQNSYTKSISREKTYSGIVHAEFDHRFDWDLSVMQGPIIISSCYFLVPILRK